MSRSLVRIQTGSLLKQIKPCKLIVYKVFLIVDARLIAHLQLKKNATQQFKKTFRNNLKNKPTVSSLIIFETKIHPLKTQNQIGLLAEKYWMEIPKQFT